MQLFLTMTGAVLNNEQLCVLAQQGNADARNQLIINNLPFIKKTACELWNAQSQLNQTLHIDTDALIQEGSMGLHGCNDSYVQDHGNLFLTYAAPAIRNAMIDYIRSQSVSFEATNLSDIVSLEDVSREEARSQREFFADATRQTPKQI